MILSESDRELVIDYIAQERAETWNECWDDYSHVLDWLIELVKNDSREEALYEVVRTLDISEWGYTALNNRSDESLLQFFLDHYDVDPSQHMIDAFVTGRILELALG